MTSAAGIKGGGWEQEDEEEEEEEEAGRGGGVRGGKKRKSGDGYVKFYTTCNPFVLNKIYLNRTIFLP